MVLAGGADKRPHLLHLATGQQAAIGSHDAPIRSVRFLDTAAMGASAPAHLFATGSWDKSVKYWDMRQPEQPLATLACADRVYAMETKSSLLVIATAEQHIHLVDLRNPTVFLRTTQSPLKHQTRAVSVFPDGRGWATASIEGRCGINAVDEKKDGKRYYRIIMIIILSLRQTSENPNSGIRLLSFFIVVIFFEKTRVLTRCHLSSRSLQHRLHFSLPPLRARRQENHQGLHRQRRAIPPRAHDDLCHGGLGRRVPLLGSHLPYSVRAVRRAPRYCASACCRHHRHRQPPVCKRERTRWLTPSRHHDHGLQPRRLALCVRRRL